jgi:hypothetical protein
MVRRRRWAIAAYPVGGRPGRDYIASSVGRPYQELRRLARRLCRNGEGWRYAVVEYYGS